MKDVTELQIYQRALRNLPTVYNLANLLPKNEFELKSQLCKAAKSISAQIAEGYAKKSSQAEFKRFLYIALGSSDETMTHIRQIKILRFPNIQEAMCDSLIKEFKIQSKQINSLIQTIIRNPISDV